MAPAVETEPPTAGTEENETPEQDSTPSKPTIGIIYPPPELRSILFRSRLLKAAMRQ